MGWHARTRKARSGNLTGMGTMGMPCRESRPVHQEISQLSFLSVCVLAANTRTWFPSSRIVWDIHGYLVRTRCPHPWMNRQRLLVRRTLAGPQPRGACARGVWALLPAVVQCVCTFTKVKYAPVAPPVHTYLGPIGMGTMGTMGYERAYPSSWMSLTTHDTRTYRRMPPINPLATRASHSVVGILVVLDSFAVLP